MKGFVYGKDSIDLFTVNNVSTVNNLTTVNTHTNISKLHKSKTGELHPLLVAVV